MVRNSVLDRRRQWLPAVVLARGVALVALAAWGAVLAQPPPQGGLELNGPDWADDDRDELYRLLQEQSEILEAQAAVVKTVARLIRPVVVHIEADVTNRSRSTRGGGYRVEEAGAGVIVRLGDRFCVLTNRHVISGASLERITITLADGRQLHPLEIWSDSTTDVGVMAIQAPGLVAARIGDARMEIGDFVLAAGSPFGLSHSITFGIISATGRRDLKLGQVDVRRQNFLQTDAAINPGNSGGPLINLRGEVVGINTAIACNSGGSEGVGFAIPIGMFMSVAEQLVEHGQVSWGYLGVLLDDAFGPAMAAEVGLPRPYGARVVSVSADSPAEAAGLRANDIVLRIDDTQVEDDGHLVNIVSFTPVGREIALEVFRDRQAVRLKVVIGKWGER